MRYLLIIITWLLVCQPGGAKALQPLKIAFIGDSLTLGAVDGINPDFVGFAERVAQARGADFERFVFYTFNETEDNWPQVVDYQPDEIVIELGIHIISGRDHNQTDDEVRLAAAEIMDRSLALTGNVTYVLIPWRGWGDENNQRALDINAIITTEALKRDIKLADSWEPIEVCGLACIGYDDSHPNGDGHQIIANAVIAAQMTYKIYLPLISMIAD